MMKNLSTFPIMAAIAAVLLLPVRGVQAQTTRVVTPPGTTTRVTTTPGGDQVITVTVNNKPVAFEERRGPVMYAGRVFIPLRGVIERLGGEVKYEKASQVVTGAHSGAKRQFRIRVGSSDALVNGENTLLDAPPRLVNGTTYVPLRFVSEAMGARVVWDTAKRTVIVTAADGSETTVETP